MSAARIVGFLPYVAFTKQRAQNVARLHALKQQGYDVTLVLCDGVFSDCDLHRPPHDGPWQRPANACLICQAEVAGLMAKSDMPYRWLGRWLDEEDFRTAAAWIANLRAAQYAHASYNDWPIGQWVQASLQQHFQTPALDLNRPDIAQTWASYMNSTLLACFGLSRLYDELAPEELMTLNTQRAVLRAAVELAKTRGIRTHRGDNP